MGFISMGQVTVRNMRLTVPDSNLLYVQAHNDLELSGMKTRQKLTIKSTDISVVEMEADNLNAKRLFVYPKKAGKLVLHFYAGKKLILSKEYMAVKLNLPKAQLGSITDSFASHREMINSSGLNIVIPGAIYIAYWEINSFQLSIFDRSSKVIFGPVTNYGNRLTASQKELFNELKPGDQILFERITVSGADTRNFRLPPFKITVK
jgi:hypothetical protein